MANDSPCLPQEIITNILVRLPVKSLIRFQCVCKDWKNLFKTRSFIAEHLHHSAQQSPLLVVDCIISESSHWHLRSLNREMQVLEFQNQNPHTIDSIIESVCSSNGLLCVELSVESQRSFWLWNPSIREVRQVPESLSNYEHEDYAVGFGFSPIVNDYKIVKLFRSNHLFVQVGVYALRTGLWRKVELGTLEGINFLYNSFACNGAVFWFGRKVNSNVAVLVSFDLAMEVFTMIPFPTLTSFTRSYFSSLTMYKNKLAMLSPTLNEDLESNLTYLWVLEESTDPSRERWNWTKLYTSRPDPYGFNISPGIIWRNEIVCEPKYKYGQENHESQVVLCNLSTDEFNIFAIPKRSYFQNVFDHVESLVLLDSVHS